MSEYAEFAPDPPGTSGRACDGLVIRDAREADLDPLARILAAREQADPRSARRGLERSLVGACARGAGQLLIAEIPVGAPSRTASDEDRIVPSEEMRSFRQAAAIAGFGKTAFLAPSGNADNELAAVGPAAAEPATAGPATIGPASAGPATPDLAPDGWYLTGLVVAPPYRRRGIGARLTRARMEWIALRSPTAWYVANARNLATIELHRRLGFVEVTRSFRAPGVAFEGGIGVLCRADLHASNSPRAGGCADGST